MAEGLQGDEEHLVAEGVNPAGLAAVEGGRQLRDLHGAGGLILYNNYSVVGTSDGSLSRYSKVVALSPPAPRSCVQSSRSLRSF